MIKKRFVAILAAACTAGALCLAGCSQGGDDQLKRIKEKGEMVVAMEGTWAPWTYHDENDTLVGFDVEVSQKLAETLGVKASVVEGDGDGLLAGLDSKRYDIVCNGVEITEERAEKYEFSEPYAYIHTAIIVRGDNDSIHSFEDLKDKQTANTISSTYAALAESYGATAIGVDALDQTMELVLAGRVDATLNAELSFYDYMKVHPDANLKIVALAEDASGVVIPVRKGKDSEAFLEALNKAIVELRESGDLGQISTKYFDVDISNKE